MSSAEPRRLVLRNNLSELDRLAGWVEGWTQEQASPDISFAIQFCVEEAVANVIMYGSSKDDRLEIAVELERENGTLVARVVDNGRQFDPTQAPAPPEPSSLATAQVGKLGIHLVRSFANGMGYERRDGHNRLTLRFVESQRSS